MVTRGHWDDTDLQAIDAHFFGGTVFRYATIFGTGFSTTCCVGTQSTRARFAGPGLIRNWDRLDDEHFLQMGMFYRYLVGAVREVLEALGLAHLGLADGVYVVYPNADE